MVVGVREARKQMELNKLKIAFGITVFCTVVLWFVDVFYRHPPLFGLGYHLFPEFIVMLISVYIASRNNDKHLLIVLLSIIFLIPLALGILGYNWHTMISAIIFFSTSFFIGWAVGRSKWNKLFQRLRNRLQWTEEGGKN